MLKTVSTKEENGQKTHHISPFFYNLIQKYLSRMDETYLYL